MTDEGLSELKPCPLCGAGLLPDEVTKTNEVVVWRHAHNACLLNGALPGIRVPHDVEAWNRRSARTSTAPVARWAQPGDKTDRVWMIVYDDADRSTAVFEGPRAEADAREQYERSWPSWNCYLFAAQPHDRASPPPPQPGVRVTVKPLEWQKHTDNAEWYSDDDPTGDGRGLYWVRPSDINPGQWDLCITNHREDSYRSPDEAKAAAQSDFNARVQRYVTASIPDSGEGWRPISTAPKDRWVLGVIAGEYRPGEPYVPMSIRWHEGWGGFLDVTRWHAYESQDEDRAWEGMSEPTHWRHLPTPPVT